MTKARMTDLSDLLGAKKTRAPQSEPAPEPESPGAAPRDGAKSNLANEVPTPGPVASQAEASALQVGKAPTALASIPIEGTPRYLTLVRKELRISQAQADQLSSTVRALNLARRGEGERITDNTLVRVAIGLLLERLRDLRGTTEDELFLSLGIEPTE